MLLNKTNYLNFHLNKNEFLSSIEYTATQTGFRPELIEKDYYCSLALQYLFQHNPLLVFKGGTLLAKVHAGFYRLSEDLDFTLPTSPLATRSQRSNKINPIKEIIASIENTLPIFKVHSYLTGSNNSLQYNGSIIYPSILSDNVGRILVEIGLREELLTASLDLSINTLLLNPFTNNNLVPPIKIHCLSKEEAYAEKFRAALTRKSLAIRDFYDLHYATKNNIINLEDPILLELTKQKIKNDNQSITIFNDKTLNFLEEKITSELIPTLKFSEAFSKNELKIIIKKLKDFTDQIV